MKDLLILIIFGLILFVTGIIFLKRERRLFEDSAVTIAKLVNYYEYRAAHSNLTMYSMEVVYTTYDGTMIRAREQGGYNRKKYVIGTVFDIYYSKEKPELFMKCGDNSRKLVLYGMVIVGMVLMGLFGYMYLNGGA